MRYLAWIAIVSLQIGMFVCGAGIDVCHATDAPAHIASSQSDQDQPSTTVDPTCVAHAAHVFLAHATGIQEEVRAHPEPITLLAALNLPEVPHAIEQPPKFSHS